MKTQPGSVKLHVLKTAIEHHLEKIEGILGENYKLTLLAKYHGPLPLNDADILLSMDTRENMLAVIDRFCPLEYEPQPTSSLPAAP